MSHKQLYTKVFHLNPATIAEMGMLPEFVPNTYPIEPNNIFNSILRIGTIGIETNFLVFLPKEAEIVSMWANNKYFFLYDESMILPVTFEPFFSTIMQLVAAEVYCGSLNISIKGPTKEQIPDKDKLYSVLKAYAVGGPMVPLGRKIPFNIEHLYNLDLVVNYTLPE